MLMPAMLFFVGTGLQGLFVAVLILHGLAFGSMLVAIVLTALARLISSARLRNATYFLAVVLTVSYLVQGWWIALFRSEADIFTVMHAFALLFAAVILLAPVLDRRLWPHEYRQFSLRFLFVAMLGAAVLFGCIHMGLPIPTIPLVATVLLVMHYAYGRPRRPKRPARTYPSCEPLTLWAEEETG